MQKIFIIIVLFLSVVLFQGCTIGDDNGCSGEIADVKKISINGDVTEIPTLIVIMNWTNYQESDTSFWHNKFFDTSTNGVNSVNRWSLNNTNNNIKLIPVLENDGVQNDGIVIVNMNKAHPGAHDDTSFRENEIRTAIGITNSFVDFASYDADSNTYISEKEMQIIFIVAGGEAAYSGILTDSVWAHAWYYDGGNAPSHDGVTLMKYDTNQKILGSYAVFGSIHGLGQPNAHKATIGIIVHELGHSLYNLVDLYDLAGGSGLGYYDIMSGGAWGQKDSFDEPGESPTQFSPFSQIDMKSTTLIQDIYADSISLKCSSNEMIKLITSSPNEYFLLECRDTLREDSDQSLNNKDSAFTGNRLFTTLYHVDENKELNTQSGIQTSSNHYKVRVVEKDVSQLMTSVVGIDADFDDVYIEGEVIAPSKSTSYSGESGYKIEILDADYSNRTMTYTIQK